MTGVASRDIYEKPGTPGQEVVFPPTVDRIPRRITPGTVRTLAKFAVTRDWITRRRTRCSQRRPEVARGMACNPDGALKEGTGIDWHYPAVTTHNPRDEYSFYYDWREDPMDVARDFKDFIDYICAETGHSKVNIIAFSMGTIITMAYIRQFGYDQIAGLAMSAPALNGVTCAGEPYAGNLKFDPAGIVRYVDALTGVDGGDNLIDALMQVLYKAGAIDAAAAFLSDGAADISERLYSD